MRVLYRHPDSCHNERRYIVTWLFEEVLGWQVDCRAEERDDQQFEVEGENGSLNLPDSFFGMAEDRWLSRKTMPQEPLVETQGLPALYGSGATIDVLGSLFFLLSRYEEAVEAKRDDHSRFPSQASVLGRAGLLHRAIGNEYIECFWEAMNRSWPGITRRERTFRVVPSHDVDCPSKFWKTWRRTFRAVFHRLRTGRLREGARHLWDRLGYQRWHRWEDDPWDTISWLLETSEGAGWQSTFYYISEQTHPIRDPGMPIEHGHVVDQWQRIAATGHKLGVHPGYGTFNRPDLVASAAGALRSQMEKLEIRQDDLGGRQHYLRWESPLTARAYEAAGLSHDASMGFPEQAGFRAGVCYEYPWYDVQERRALGLRERPLILMDVTLSRPDYMGLGLGEKGYHYARDLKDQCRRFRGDFSVLWHNSHLETEEDRDFYRQLLSA